MKKLIAITMSLCSLGNISAQEVQDIQEKTNYGNRGLETNILAHPTFRNGIDGLRQTVDFNQLQNFSLNNTPSPSLTGSINTSKDYQRNTLMLYGSGDRDVMIGLMDKQDAEVGIMYHRNSLSFDLGLMANVYNFNPLQGSPIRNQFGINGSLRYDFNENVSVTVYGRYVNNPFYQSMAAFPYIATSSYGGYFTLQNEKVGIDLGVNNYYDVFSRSWRTDPIVRPKYKIGKVKLDMDLGPLMKEGILRLAGKKRYEGPMIMPLN